MRAQLLAYYDGKLGRRRVIQAQLNRALRALRNYYGDATERALRKAVKGIRPHASYFKWTNRQKETEELGVVKTLIAGLAAGDPLSTLRDLRPGRPDPPDVIGTREDGMLIALEVTELVDQEVTAHNVRAARNTVGLDPLERIRHTLYRDWDEAGFLQPWARYCRRRMERLYGAVRSSNTSW